MSAPVSPGVPCVTLRGKAIERPHSYLLQLPDGGPCLSVPKPRVHAVRWVPGGIHVWRPVEMDVEEWWVREKGVAP